MPRLTTSGKCVFCGKSYSQTGITRHLPSCAARQDAIKAANDARKSKGGRTRARQVFHIRVQGKYAPFFWLHLELSDTITLYDLDNYLRDIWLECCGHLSAFTIERTVYDIHGGTDSFGWGPPRKDMNVRLDHVLRRGLEFTHEYDFGTTTNLVLKVVDVREGASIDGKTVYQMARNDPPDIKCEVCNERPARVIDLEAEEDDLLCEECALERLESEDMLLPVVNSPRFGQCGYTGDAADEPWFSDFIHRLVERLKVREEEDDDEEEDDE